MSTIKFNQDEQIHTITHEYGLQHDRFASKNGMLVSKTWRVILSCFSNMESLQLDTMFGSTQIKWLVRDRITEIPSSHSWVTAVTARSMGMLIYLVKYKISCPDLNTLIQYASDRNHIDTLILLLHPKHDFYDDNGNIILNRKCPSIDIACVKGYYEVVNIIMSLYFPKEKEHILDDPVKTISNIMKNGDLRSLQTIVPNMMLITSPQALARAVTYNNLEVFTYALQHIDVRFIPSIPINVLNAAAKKGYAKFVQLCIDYSDGFIPLEVFNTAFEEGQKKVVQLLLSIDNTFIPSEQVLLNTCKNGHNHMITILPADIPIPMECMNLATMSRNKSLIYTLSKRLSDCKYTASMFENAVRSGSSDVIVTLYVCGKYDHISCKLIVLMVTKNCVDALQFFNGIGLDVYNKNTLLEASRVCCVGILKNIAATNLDIRPEVIDECLNRIYVSGTSCIVDRGRAQELISHRWNRKDRTRPRKSKRFLYKETPSANHTGRFKRTKNVA